MQNVARGVGLGGLVTLIFACAMAAPAAAVEVVPHTVVPHQTFQFKPPPPPAGGGIKTVVPQNSKSNLGRPVNPTMLNSQKGGDTTTGGGGTVDVTVSDSHSPKLIDPSLRFTLANKAGAHRNQLDYEGVYSGPGYAVSGESDEDSSVVTVCTSSCTVVFYMQDGHGFFNSGNTVTYW